MMMVRMLTVMIMTMTMMRKNDDGYDGYVMKVRMMVWKKRSNVNPHVWSAASSDVKLFHNAFEMRKMKPIH